MLLGLVRLMPNPVHLQVPTLQYDLDPPQAADLALALQNQCISLSLPAPVVYNNSIINDLPFAHKSLVVFAQHSFGSNYGKYLCDLFWGIITISRSQHSV